MALLIRLGADGGVDETTGWMLVICERVLGCYHGRFCLHDAILLLVRVADLCAKVALWPFRLGEAREDRLSIILVIITRFSETLFRQRIRGLTIFHVTNHCGHVS